MHTFIPNGRLIFKLADASSPLPSVDQRFHWSLWVFNARIIRIPLAFLALQQSSIAPISSLIVMLHTSDGPGIRMVIFRGPLNPKTFASCQQEMNAHELRLRGEREIYSLAIDDSHK